MVKQSSKQPNIGFKMHKTSRPKVFLRLEENTTGEQTDKEEGCTSGWDSRASCSAKKLMCCSSAGCASSPFTATAVAESSTAADDCSKVSLGAGCCAGSGPAAICGIWKCSPRFFAACCRRCSLLAWLSACSGTGMLTSGTKRRRPFQMVAYAIGKL